MARETVYLVQAFTSGKGTRLTADTPVRCRSPELARRKAEDLVPSWAGVVAFSTWGDAELGDTTTSRRLSSRRDVCPQHSRRHKAWREAVGGAWPRHQSV